MGYGKFDVSVFDIKLKLFYAIKIRRDYYYGMNFKISG